MGLIEEIINNLDEHILLNYKVAIFNDEVGVYKWLIKIKYKT